MCHFSSYWGGAIPAILDIIYVFLWHESEAQGLSVHCNKKVGKLELSLLGIPANTAHPKQDSTNSNNRLSNTILRNMEHKSVLSCCLIKAYGMQTELQAVKVRRGTYFTTADYVVEFVVVFTQ